MQEKKYLILQLLHTKEKYMKKTYYIASWWQGKDEGITRIVYDASIDKLYSKEIVNSNKRSSYFARNNEFLYVLTESEMSTPNQGLISAYKMDENGLTLLSKSSYLDSGLTHLTLSADKKHLYASGYGTGSLTIADIKNNKLINERVAYRHNGSSINAKRQLSSHIHFSIPTPDEEYLCACDLGTDEIHIFQVNKDNGDLRKSQSIKTPLGYGPRHMIFSKDGKYAYVLCEMTYHLLVYAYNKGSLKLLNDIDLIPECPIDARACSAIKLSADGNVLFTANRGKEYACIEAFDLKDPVNPHKLDSYDKVSFPRDFTLFEDGYVGVCNQSENNVEFIRFLDNKFESVGIIRDIRLPVSIIEN